MGKDPVKIVVADPQALARAGFRLIFGQQPLVKVVGEAADAEQLEQLVIEHQPTVLACDYLNGADFSLADLTAVRKQHPQIQVMVVTHDQDRGRIRQVLDMGVPCILTKHCSPEEIITAALSTAKGERFFCNKVLEVILDKEPAEDCSPSNLSSREIEIVRLVASGISTKDIADQLCLSTHTVYTHRKNIMKKLQINSASEMILFAMNSGIIGPGNT